MAALFVGIAPQTADAWVPRGCVRPTDAFPATPARDVQVAFQGGGHPTLPNYYRDIGIDAANAWYAGTHALIFWSSTGNSQVGTMQQNRGLNGIAGQVQKGTGPVYVNPCTTSQNYYTNDTWVVMNVAYTNGYTDNKNRAIMVHELGHAVGLAHSDVAPCDAIMHQYVIGEFTNCGGIWVPRWDDVYGIEWLY